MMASGKPDDLEDASCVEEEAGSCVFDKKDLYSVLWPLDRWFALGAGL